MGRHLFTSESVTEGHPDKLCDRISDAIVDAYLAQDPDAHMAIETMTTTGMIMVVGEVKADPKKIPALNIDKLVRETVKDIGYSSSEIGFDHEGCAVLVSLHDQSVDIDLGVSGGSVSKKLTGAGDQGLMFGYATNETPELMPLPISMAQKLAMQLAKVRKDGTLPWLRPDGKTQVTVEYEDGVPKRIDTIVVSTQHAPEINGKKKDADVQKIIHKAIMEKVIMPVCGDWVDKKTIYHINPTGRFVIGGPCGDSGLTGRKIIVDTYGGMGRHGGGAFSGKDPTKVDRSAAYMCRYIAKNIVAAAFDENDTGFDIEEIKPRNLKRLSEYFHRDFVDENDFYRYWTSYEAEYKSQKQEISSFKFENYMCSVSFSGINTRLKMYELVIPKKSTVPSELINLKLVNDSIKNENAVEIKEINTASLEFFSPLALKIE